MSKLSECMAKARMPDEDMAELRSHANASESEHAGVGKYLATLHDDLESLRAQLSDRGVDMSVRRYTVPKDLKPAEPKPLLRPSDNKPWPTREAAAGAAKMKSFRKDNGKGWIPTEVRGGWGLKKRAAAVQGKPRAEGPQSFLGWLSTFSSDGKRRGMYDESGELKARDAVNHFVPGKGKPFTLDHERGNNPDKVREGAIEAGFLPEGASVNDVYKLIDHELAGRKQYRPDEHIAPKEVGEKDAAAAKRDDLERTATDYGIDHAGKTDKQLEELLDAHKSMEDDADNFSHADMEEIEAELDAELAEADNAPDETGHPKRGQPPADGLEAGPRVEDTGVGGGGRQVEAAQRPEAGAQVGEVGAERVERGQEAQGESPALAPHEGSWVVVKKGTLEPVLETFDKKKADAVNRSKYDVLTAGDYLGRKNREIRGASEPESVAAPSTDKVTVYDENNRPKQADHFVVPGAEKSEGQAVAKTAAERAAEEERARLKGRQTKMRGSKPQEKVGHTPEEEKAALNSMREALDQAGIHDVSAAIVDKFQRAVDGRLAAAPDVQGRYRVAEKALELAKWIALGGKRAQVLGHEMMHALKALGLLRDHEWKALEAAADKSWMAKYRIAERYPNLSLEKQREEAIAEAFGDYHAKRGVGPKTVIGRIFQRAIDGLGAIGRWATGKTAEPYLKTFEAIHRGDVGRRTPEDKKVGGIFTRDKAFGERDSEAWHGTPHDFDEFDMSKIGTGEGSQVYGHGLYFAGKRGVAEYYRNNLSHNPNAYLNGERVPPGSWLSAHLQNIEALTNKDAGSRRMSFEQAREDALTSLQHQRGQRERAAETATDPQMRRGAAADVQEIDDASDKLAKAKESDIEFRRGRLFKVDLTPKDEDWLDHDKPMSEQSPEVLKRLKAMASRGGVGYQIEKAIAANYTGRELYDNIAKDLGGERMMGPPDKQYGPVRYTDEAAASAALHDAGIPGVRYRDQNSRDIRILSPEESTSGKWVVGERTGNNERFDNEAEARAKYKELVSHNYVVFDPKHIDVQEKLSKGGRGPAGLEDVRGKRATDTPEFKKWFGESKVTDDKGEPKIVYHGTPVEKFDAFQNSQSFWVGPGMNDTAKAHAIFFTDSKDTARSYGKKLEPVWLAMDHPLEVDAEGKKWGDVVPYHFIGEAIRDGHDGVIVKNIRDDSTMGGEPATTYIALDPRQVKSATENNGKFEVENPNFRESRAPKGGTEDVRGKKGGYTHSVPGMGGPEYQGPPRGPVARNVDRLSARLKSLVDEHAPALMDLGADVKMALNPMSAGSEAAQATAKDFANAVRQSRWEWNRVDRLLAESFTPEQQKKMWEAADEQSVLEQKGKRTKGKGLDRLAPQERAAVEGLQKTAKDTFDIARKLGMIESEGLPSYVPRMVVDMATGKAVKNKAGESSSTLDAIGGNLRTTTSQLLNRKHLTVAETEEAAKAKFGESAGVLRNIRTLAMATAKLQDAISGRVLVDKIKEMGRKSGAATVADSIPEDTTHKWFTIDTPALKTWRPRLARDKETGKMQPVEDSNGDMVFDKVPVYVRGDFEGPLRAVLSGKDGMVYKALMNLKARTMSVIMYSPLIHNGVEWGRALAAMPGKVATFKIYFEGNAAKKDPLQMREAVNAGMVPIGARYGFQDISSLMEEPSLTPGRSWTAQILSAIPGFLDPRAGDAVKRAVDKMGDVWHNTLLWDRIADLQMGLYTNFRDNLVAKGTDSKTAQRLAAHLANRYAGAMPTEAMSAGARKLGNLVLFSRSFTLGNLGAMKDAITGVPSDVKAQILRDAGKLSGTAAEKYVTRKSRAIMAIDIGLNYLMTAAASSAAAVLAGNTSVGDEAYGYVKRLYQLMQRGKENPLELLNPMEDIHALTPQSENEPGKQDRVYVGRAADGSAVYMRLPMGKIGEEFEGWLTKPLEMLKRKESTIARPAIETFTNDKGFGRHVYDPYDKAPGASVRALGRIVMNFMGEQVPLAAIDGVKRLITGEGDARVNAAQSLGPLAGITFSKGAPGGPEMGEYWAAKDEHNEKLQEAMPGIRDKIRRGDRGEAIKDMTDLGIPPSTQANYMRSTLNPRRAPSPQQLSSFRRYATKEQRERLEAEAAREASR